jgi:hypothetical protein
VLDDLAELVEQQVAVAGRVRAAVGSPLPSDGVGDQGEVTGPELRRIGPARGRQCRGGGLAGAQRLTQPLQRGADRPG